MERPLVLHVLEALEGGTARHLVDVVRYVDARHEVVIPPSRAGGVTDEHAPVAMRDAGARVHVLDMRRSPARLENALALVRLRRLVAELGPDIVHGHSSVGGALARAAAWSAPARRVYTPNGLLPRATVLAAERVLGRRTDRLVAVSESEAATAARARLVPAGRLTVIPNGIELEPPPPPPGPGLRERLGLDATTPLVGSVGRLVPQKAPEDLVRAWAIVARRRPDAHFVLVAAGPQQRLLDREVAATGVRSRFHQIRALPGVGALLGELDVFVLASRFEGCPYSALEAMRAGTPVVLSDAVGNRDVVEDGVSGLLAPVGNAERLATAVLAVLDGALAAGFVDAARRRLRERFGVAAMGEALSELYRELLAPR